MSIEEVYKRLTQLSFKAFGYSSPNPPVSCVITDLNDTILSEGFTQVDGKEHAERIAYLNLENPIPFAHKVYVSLEPCTHQGRTPPCLDLVLKYKPKELIIGQLDPNPLVKQRNGLEECNKLGIRVRISEEIKTLTEIYLRGFLKRIQKEEPVIILKTALSRNGFFKSSKNQNFKFTNSESDNLTQILRAKVDAVLVGPNTIQIDSPSLNLRNLQKLKNPISNLIDDSMIEFMNMNLKEHQPYRIFYIDRESRLNRFFLEKQSKIDQENQNKKAVFILESILEESNLRKVLNGFTDLVFIIDSKRDQSILKNELKKIFSKLKFNTLLIEGGNLFYELFSRDADFVFKICTETNLESGMKPKIDWNFFELQKKIEVATDIWEIYKNVYRTS
jgi:diaminohydroxyphosphoribosylaminopyrimidine deaminase/5-amino-6-(5-phosphoribosylamino)uracil reductase